MTRIFVLAAASVFWLPLFSQESAQQPSGPGKWVTVKDQKLVPAKYSVCPQCKGKGVVKVSDLKHLSVSSETCPRCNGTGKVVDEREHYVDVERKVWQTDFAELRRQQIERQAKERAEAKEKAASELQAKAVEGDPEACYKMATGGDVSGEMAAAYLMTAARKGSQKALFSIARTYERGDSINLVEAYKWYRLAQIRGSDSAASRVSQISTGLSREKRLESEKWVEDFVAKYFSGSGEGASAKLPSELLVPKNE